ncbi:anti-anti-sigma factor [Mycobacterium sp. IS-1590]|uniref:STAS domain-containing protein n=1 Tax=Mycobacterium sp. IS-1590 TaxID=1772286 RepID=UPI0007490BB5|nr:STAS domain-containing protein [Mycobacterium sp. IS-1590]KUI45250.1 anti-anti-sigma factor [Mycobacterium sp. IS-1590]
MSISHISGSIPEAQVVETRDCHTAYFATRRPRPDTAIVAAHGEIDAANSRAFVDYAMRDAAQLERLVIDLSGVEFFGTAGFSALHTLNVRTAGEKIEWAMVPSASVSRLLRICDPDAALPVCDSLESALSSAGEVKPLLKLVPKSG